MVEIRPAPYEGDIDPTVFDAKEHFPGGVEFGVLTLDGTERLCAMDGQHRLRSIELAIRQKPELAREHITLILVPFHSVARSQSLFSDLNRYAKSPSKSISLLFTHRESLARITKELAHTVPLLRDRVNMENTSLSSNARQFVTLSTLYEMTKALVDGRDTEDPASEQQIAAELTAVLTELTQAIEVWRLVASGEEHPAYLRQRHLCMHGVASRGSPSPQRTPVVKLPTTGTARSKHCAQQIGA